MSGHDLLFWTFSLAAAAAALASALEADLSRATSASLLGGVALVVLLGLAGAPLAATLAGACVFAAHAFRESRRRAGKAQGSPAVDDAATLVSRLRSGALVAALFALAVRGVLITRWPLAADAQGSVSLAHFLVLALVLLAIGLFAALTRRSVAGLGLGLATAASGVVLALAAASAVAVRNDAGTFAAFAVLVFAGAGLAMFVVAERSGDLDRASDAAWRVAGNLSSVIAVVALALLATAW